MGNNQPLPAAAPSRSPCNTVMVCGHGRCGSSLVMQMLQAGGFPVFGEYPAFEPDETGFDRNPETLLPLIHGKAAKVLDPQLTDWPDMMNVRVIWMDRNRNEQAKSQVKFLRLVGGLNVSESMRRNISASYGMDTAMAMARFRDIGILPLRVRFEDLVTFPDEVSRRIAEHLQVRLDVEAMERAVIKRHPACAPGMDIELYLVSQGSPDGEPPQANPEISESRIQEGKQDA